MKTKLFFGAIAIICSLLAGCGKDKPEALVVLPSNLLDENTLGLYIGDKERITSYPENMIVLSSDNKAVATVDPATGEVVATGIGSTVIRATTPDGSQTERCNVYVVEEVDDILPMITDPTFHAYCVMYLISADYANPEGNEKLSSKEAVAVREIDFDAIGADVASLAGIEYFVGLDRLSCSNNQLTELDVSKNTALTNLDCRGNLLTLLDLSHNTMLRGLMCDSNRLTELDLSKNTEITSVYCTYNQLTALDVSYNPALTVLHCYANNLTALDISNNPNLTILWCYYNQLKELDLSKNTALTSMFCDNNPGDGTIFLVKAWFDNSGIPNTDFTTGSWDYNGATITIDYQKVK